MGTGLRDMDETAQFLLEFGKADEVAVAVDLLPKVLPTVKTSTCINIAVCLSWQAWSA